MEAPLIRCSNRIASSPLAAPTGRGRRKTIAAGMYTGSSPNGRGLLVNLLPLSFVRGSTCLPRPFSSDVLNTKRRCATTVTLYHRRLARRLADAGGHLQESPGGVWRRVSSEGRGGAAGGLRAGKPGLHVRERFRERGVRSRPGEEPTR